MWNLWLTVCESDDFDLSTTLGLNVPVEDDREEVCCNDGLGGQEICYSNMDAGVRRETMMRLPKCAVDLQPQFFIFDARNPKSVALKFTYSSEFAKELQKLNVDKKREFFTITHGFRTKFTNIDDKSLWMVQMKDALVDLGHNVLIVDWTRGSGAEALDYPQAAGNTRSIGTALGNVLNVLVKNGAVEHSLIRLIGFSLGAHTAGYAGGKVMNERPHRIIGKDDVASL